MKTIINYLRSKTCIVTGLLLLMSVVSYGQMSITTPGVAVVQQFTIGSTATAALPSGFKVGNTGVYSVGTAATTLAAGTSGAGIIGTTGGCYNFSNGVTATSTDRAVGFLNSGTFTSPRDLMLQIQNNTGGVISDLAITFDYEKYRSGTRSFTWTFFKGTDGSTWSAVNSGDQVYAADFNNTTISNPPTSINKSINITGLSIPNGGFYYFKWTFTGLGGSTNGQAIGVDNVSVTATTPTPAISLSSIPNFTTIGGVTAPTQTYTVAGANLTQGITLTPSNSNFEISTDGVSFGVTPIIIPQVSGTINPTLIYVRMSPTTVGTFTGSITHTTLGAVTQTQNLTGNVVPSLWYSVASGNINGAAVWSSTPSGSPDPIAHTKFRPDVSLIIQNGHTILLASFPTNNLKDLTINSGGKLWRNSSSTSNMVYLNVYGNITNNGEIGNGTTFDAVGINIEGNCNFTGVGIHNIGRVRKNTSSLTSTLTISTDSINVRFPGLGLYNAFDNTQFNVIIPTGKKLTLPNGEFSLCSTNGTGNNSNMNLTVNGNLTALGSGTSFLINLNPSSLPTSPIDNTNSSNLNIGSVGKLKVRNLDVRQTSVMSFNINSGGNVYVYGNMRMFAGTLITNNGLTIENGGNLLSGTGFTYPYTPSGGNVSGNVKIKKVGDTNYGTYNFWSSPITNSTLQPIVTAGQLAGSAMNTYQYDPTTATTNPQSGWVNTPPSTLMTPGKGYITTGAGSVTFNGPVNESTINLPITQGTNSNFNLVGNPYPSTLTPSGFLTANGLSALYLWDDDQSYGADYQQGDYIVVGVLGTVTGSQTTPSAVVTGVSPCQSFFIESTNPSVTFNNTMRSTIQSTFFEDSIIQRFWLNVSNTNNSFSNMLIAFVEDATMERDVQYDAIPMGGVSPTFDFWSKSADNYDLRIQAVPHITDNISIPLGFNSNTIGDHTISLGNIENIDTTILFILEDRTLNIFHSLRQSDYTFTLSSSELGSERFILHIKRPVIVSGNVTNCLGSGGEITINGPSDWVYSFNEQIGQLSDTTETTLQNIPAGTYNVILYNGSYMVNQSVEVTSPTPVSISINDVLTPIYVGEEFTLSYDLQGSDSATIYYGDNTNITDSQTHSYNEPGIYSVVVMSNNSECSAIGQTTINVIYNILSVEKLENKNYFYPNPTNGVIYINSNTKSSVKIYNSVGQLIKDEFVTTQMNLNDLITGMYIISVNGSTNKLFINK
jgi:hypothetical protein